MAEVNCSYSDGANLWNPYSQPKELVDEALTTSGAKKSQTNISSLSERQIAQDGSAAIKAKVQEIVGTAIAYGLSITPLAISGCELPSDLINMLDEADGLKKAGDYKKAIDLYVEFVNASTEQKEVLNLRSTAVYNMLLCIERLLPALPIKEKLDLFDEEKMMLFDKFLDDIDTILACYLQIIDDISNSPQADLYVEDMMGLFKQVRKYFGDENLHQFVEDSTIHIGNFIRSIFVLRGFDASMAFLNSMREDEVATLQSMQILYAILLNTLLTSDPAPDAAVVAEHISEVRENGGDVWRNTADLEFYASGLTLDEFMIFIGQAGDDLPSQTVIIMYDDAAKTALEQDPLIPVEDAANLLRDYFSYCSSFVQSISSTVAAALGHSGSESFVVTYFNRLDLASKETFLELTKDFLPEDDLNELVNIFIGGVLGSDPPLSIEIVSEYLQEYQGFDLDLFSGGLLAALKTYLKLLDMFIGPQACLDFAKNLEAFMDHDAIASVYYALAEEMLSNTDSFDNEVLNIILESIKKYEQFSEAEIDCSFYVDILDRANISIQLIDSSTLAELIDLSQTSGCVIDNP